MRIPSAVLLVACAVSCAHPAPPPTPPPTPAPTLADEVDAMCACTTAGCETGVRAKFASVDRASDTAPHTLALRAYLKQCDAQAEEADDMADMRQMSVAMCKCKDAACVDKVQIDFATFMKRMEDKYKNDRRPSEQMMEIGEHMAKCMSDAMGMSSGSTSGIDGSGGASSSVASGGPTGVAECDAYLKAFDTYLSCPKIPQEAKDASQQGIEQMKEGWAMLRDPDVPAEARRAAADACKQAIDALKQSAHAMGCPM